MYFAWTLTHTRQVCLCVPRSFIQGTGSERTNGEFAYAYTRLGEKNLTDKLTVGQVLKFDPISSSRDEKEGKQDDQISSVHTPTQAT